MALKVGFQQPDFSTPRDNPSVVEKEPEPELREHTNGAGPRAGDGHVLPTDPARTRSRDNMSLDEIETKKSYDGRGRGDANEPTLTFTDTVKHATHTAKRKLYLHHRNQRRLSKQFTAGSAFHHLPWTKHGKAKTHDAEAQAEHDSGEALSFLQNFKIMLTTFPYWNMAFWSGWCYSIGSAMFVVDGAWAWVPQQWPDSEFSGQEKYGVPLLFFFGACLYQVGGVMAYLEAVNDGSFAGAAMKHLFEGHQEIEKEFLDAKLHTFFGHIVPHHHRDDEDDDQKSGKTNHNDDDYHWDSLQNKETKPEEVYAEAKKLVQSRGGFDQGAAKKRDEGEVEEYLTWRWWPSWLNLKTYHIFELGYLACAIQLLGVTLYGVTSIVILPGILDKLVWWQELWAYWLPQVVASCCFLIASVMFTIMAQDKWHTPRVGAVSWWIGTWAIIGSVGFL